jgi:anaerobic ribonucleoside-triphosphate reductase activating protein
MGAAILHLAAYLPRSRANGPGVRAVAWVQGCPLRCPGCFNPAFWPFTGGQPISIDDLAQQILADGDTEGVSFSGGEPFAQAAALARLAKQLQAAGKGVLIFTGFAMDELRTHSDPSVHHLLERTDLLVAGPYQREQPCHHPLRASANQELIYLTARYRNLDLGPRRVEYRINAHGVVTTTGFPSINKTV